MKTATKTNSAASNRESIPNSPYLFGEKHFENPELLVGNIENFIGMAMIPTGLIGPVKVNGSQAKGEFTVPLSTTEGALVASYNRGAKACHEAGGATSICVGQGVQRSPVLKFSNLNELLTFLDWVNLELETFREITSKVSRFARLIEMRTNIEGNHLTLTFEYFTGDASGQNMVTFCTQHICEFIMENAPVKPKLWFIEGNYSGDKKATSLSFSHVRGKKVVSEIVLPKSIVENTLKSSAKAMADYWLSSTLGVVQSGSIGAQGHYANGLAALFIATGQDVACVSEASVGITRMEALPNGSLYASVTLPGLIVGTVGGGTGLPTQKEALEIMECFGEGKAVKFAEIIGAVILAGELSIAAALSAGHFASAHQKLGRKTNPQNHKS
ncbi:hydroxymethylglutaryl-CoA reductase [Flavobacterium sp.]|uniref:hydroxymethylglutaryl-CoA reductase n=1 Tax=Flavobacterium sp. TaxID=239 RepID=UPI001224BBF6|nr:hydroxymethylglutaryl-CoA reductase [Flavobacterium sp.]RZJ73455.1 MAG: 3-hydroxy-3-methylglutaryl-CoA reductase [Flavobacterium sp.]